MPTGELDVLSIELGALQTRHPSRFQSQLLLDALEDLRLNIVANPRAASLASRLLSQSNRSIDVLSQPLQSASQGLEALQGIDMQGVYHGGENPWESSVELNGLCRPALQLLASLASGRRLPNSTQEDHTTSTWRDTSNSRFKTIQSAVTHTSAWHERVFKMGSGFEPRRRRLLSEIDGTRFVYSGKLSKDLYGLRRVTIQSELYGLRHEKRYDTKEKRQKAFTHITRNPGLRSRQRELLIRGLGRTCTECVSFQLGQRGI